MNPPLVTPPSLRRISAGSLPSSSSSLARAFTLIEILVVVAIIAILAAIAFPVAGGMLDRGADASDLNNLRQIGTAISQFAAENSGRIPNDAVSISGASATDGTPRSSFMESVDRFSAAGREIQQRIHLQLATAAHLVFAALCQDARGQEFQREQPVLLGSRVGYE
jgi:prepilin-type N-terminal cleavage/methylation domain-containing protein